MNENKRKRELPIGIEFGKLPPQNIALEETILGSFLFDTQTHEYIPMISEDTFYRDSHKMMYAAMRSLFDSGRKIDILTLQDELRKTGNLDEVGGVFAISQLMNTVASVAHLNDHIRILLELSVRRNVIKHSTISVHQAYDEMYDLEDVLSNMDRERSELIDKLAGGAALHLSEVGHQIDMEEKAREKSGDSPDIFTGFRDVDEMVKVKRGDMVVIAARPSMGKTALMLKIGLNMAMSGERVGMLSMEMTRESIYKRCLCILSGLSFYKVDNKNNLRSSVDFDAYNDAKRQLNALPFFIDDYGSPTISQYTVSARRMKRKFNVDILIGDHIGQITDPKLDKEYSVVTRAARQIKNISKELDIPTFMGCQLSRKVESRKDCRPMLSDLRESGAIEEVADIVGLLYRPEYYKDQGLGGFDTTEYKGRKIITTGYAEVNWAKNRNGSTGITGMQFVKRSIDFRDYEWEHAEVKPVSTSNKKTSLFDGSTEDAPPW